MSGETEEIGRARQALAAVPGVGTIADTAEIKRLGGLTNLVFSVVDGAQRLCLRLPGKGTEAYINRANEEANARAAAAADVSPELVYFGADGVMLTRLLKDVVTMSPAAFRETPGAVPRAARAFRQLHERARPFQGRFDLFQHMDNYQALLKQLGTALPEDYDQFVQEAEVVRSALAAHPVPPKPCHCDPLCENFLDAGDRMWIVDWEYSGQNDPMWDLGDLSVEAGLGPKQEQELLECYFGGPPTPFDHGRLTIYKAMCDLLWTLWGLIQHANGNPAEDFHAYALSRFERCKAVMRKADFASHIEAVRRG